MPICNKLLNLLDGNISIESELGKGSCFSFSIPIINPSKEMVLRNFSCSLQYEDAFIAFSNEKFLKYLEKLFHFSNFKSIQISSRFTEIPNKKFIIVEEKLLNDAITNNGLIFGFQSLPNSFTIKFPIKTSKILNFQVKPVINPPLKVKLYDNKKILISEDNPIIQKTLRRMLEDSGFLKVESSFNGKETLEKLQKEFYDIILMDLQMPVLDGFQTTKQIRLWEKVTRNHSIIICITGNALKKEDMKSMEIDHLLQKPITKDELFNCIHLFLT